MTNAEWIRHFVRSHPDYKFDSVVTQSITYDLIKRVAQFEAGEVKVPIFLPPPHPPPPLPLC